MKKLIITHAEDGHWYILHGEDEYFFENFEEVSRWVENVYLDEFPFKNSIRGIKIPK